MPVNPIALTFEDDEDLDSVRAKLNGTLDHFYNVKHPDFGAIGDGTAHVLMERFGTLAEAQAFYPFAETLMEYIDKCAIQLAMSQWAAYANTGRSLNNRGGVYLPPGKYIVDGSIFTWGFVYSNSLGALAISDLGPPTVWTKTSHHLAVGQRVILGTTGTFPNGFQDPPLTYYVMADGFTASTFQLSTTPGGLVSNASDVGTGTHYLANWMGGGGKIWGIHGAVTIEGNFDGFIFDNSSITATSISNTIEGIYFRNTHANGGCIRSFQDAHKYIKDCAFNAHYGVVLQGESPDECNIDAYVEHCYFQGLGGEGAFDTHGIGLVMGPNQKAFNCTFFSFDTGLMMGGAQIAVRSCRFETNNYAMRVGRYPNFGEVVETTHAHIGSIVENISFESNVVDMRITGATGLVIRDIFSQLNVTVASPEQPIPHLGFTSLWFFAPEDITVERWLTTGVGTPPGGGIYFAGAEGTIHETSRKITFIDCVNNHGFVDDSADDGGSNAGIESIRSRGAGIVQFTSPLSELNTYGASGYAMPGAKRWCHDADDDTGTLGTTPYGTVITTTEGGANTVPVWWDGAVWRLGL